MTPKELDTIINIIRDVVHAEVAPLQKTVVALEKRLGNVENGVASLDERVTSLDRRVASLDQRLVSVDERLVKVENQGDELKRYLTRRLDEIYDAIQEVMGDMGVYTDKKVAKLSSELEPRLRKLEQVQA